MIKLFFKYYLLIIISCITLFSDNTKIDTFSYPIKSHYVITSDYGYRNLYNKLNFHNGIDFAANRNTKVYASNNGKVIKISFDKYGYGNYVVILHNNSYKTLYGHLDNKINVKINEQVTKNTVIGYVGPKILENGLKNGNTTGCHLHFTVFNEKNKHFNPLTILKKDNSN